MHSEGTLLKRAKELEMQVELENKKILLGRHKNISKGRTLLQKGFSENSNFNKELDNPSGTLFKRYEELETQNKKDRDRMTLLERSLFDRNEFVKLNKRKTEPAKIVEQIDGKITEEKDDKYPRILHYALKYRIPLVSSGVKNSYKDLVNKIHKFEMKNLKSIMRGGLDKKYKEYGLYIKTI